MSIEIERWLASSTSTTRSTSTSTQGCLAPCILHNSVQNYLEDVNQQTTASSTSAGIPQKSVRFGDDVARGKALDGDRQASLSR